MDFGGGGDIRFERRGAAGIITLTRPKALNALSLPMVQAMARALEAWKADSGVAAIVVRGEGRAFCAGGDIARVYEARQKGEPAVQFFAEEYRLNTMIESYPKPYVALIDGIVMGGGVGISCHGSHRVMTEKALFAMPEVGIGFFPDVGGSHVLPGLPGRYGYYLALTGARIKYGDALGAGLATHAMPADALEGIVAEVAANGYPDAALKAFTAAPPRETGEATLAKIAAHFSGPTLSSILASLEASAGADEFAASTLATMRQRSPTSLAVAFRQISFGAGLSMRDCMRMEFRILNRMLEGHDFYEGIRAVLIEKDNKPVWRPKTVEEVRSEDIAHYFETLGEAELTF
ncbi:MAG: enoyl-CoA hydratase/isomerase family protein [Rhizobiaceae bacterium]|jgi:enoyl-CoA hydratase/carnithine racemase|nr:MAG: enoyl-CoA hydratase/isomerase family protein [Rhizobiaceae bacterium]